MRAATASTTRSRGSAPRIRSCCLALSFAAGSTRIDQRQLAHRRPCKRGGTFTFSDFNFQPGSPQAIDRRRGLHHGSHLLRRRHTNRHRTRPGAVEDIRPGDRIHGLVGNAANPSSGSAGERSTARATRKPQLVWPVRITAGAFGIARPCRDLWLSPNHAIFMGGVLIPVKYPDQRHVDRPGLGDRRDLLPPGTAPARRGAGRRSAGRILSRPGRSSHLRGWRTGDAVSGFRRAMGCRWMCAPDRHRTRAGRGPSWINALAGTSPSPRERSARSAG